MISWEKVPHLWDYFAINLFCYEWSLQISMVVILLLFSFKIPFTKSSTKKSIFNVLYRAKENRTLFSSQVFPYLSRDGLFLNNQSQIYYSCNKIVFNRRNQENFLAQIYNGMHGKPYQCVNVAWFSKSNLILWFVSIVG